MDTSDMSREHASEAKDQKAMTKAFVTMTLPRNIHKTFTSVGGTGTPIPVLLFKRKLVLNKNEV
jgi:hypothetical protein